MALENEVNKPDVLKREARDYAPFGVSFLEAPKPVGYANEREILNYTSVTFCTWKFIPLVDDGD